MKNIYFGSKYFELVTSEKQVTVMLKAYNDHKNRTNLYTCYNKPSTAKQQIFTHWLRFTLNYADTNPVIVSYNCNFFSLAFIFTYMNSQWLAYITPTHNYTFPI